MTDIMTPALGESVTEATVASVTDSPSAGVMMSAIGDVLLRFSNSDDQAKASVRKASSSFMCRAISPAAVEAEAGRPT